MELLQEFVNARVNMSDAEREVRERELLRRRRERAVVVGWWEAVRARRAVRATRPAAGQPGVRGGDAVAERWVGATAETVEPVAAELATSESVASEPVAVQPAAGAAAAAAQGGTDAVEAPARDLANAAR